MRRIKLGFVGTGIATWKLHWPALRKRRHLFEFTAAFNRTRAKAEAFAREAGIPRVCGSLDELLALPQVEAVLVSLPIESTASTALRCLQAGRHVLAEKPLAATLEEGRGLVRRAGRLGPVLMVAENYFFWPPVRKAVQLVRRGELGKVRLMHAFQASWADEGSPYFHTAWRRKPRFPGGYLLDAGVHTAHVLREMFGMPLQVQSLKARFNPRLPPADTLLAQMRFKGGALGSWVSCFSARGKGGPLMELYGSRADLVLEWGRCRLIPHGGVERVFTGSENGYDGEFDHFHAVVARGRRLQFTPRMALADLELMLRLIG